MEDRCLGSCTIHRGRYHAYAMNRLTGNDKVREENSNAKLNRETYTPQRGCRDYTFFWTYN